MAQNDIDDVIDQLKRIKGRGDMNSVKIDEIETLEMELRFLRTFIKYNHDLLPDSLVKITKKAKSIVKNLGFDRIPYECRTKNFEGNTSSMCNFELNDSDLTEYMDYLDKNLNDLPRYLVKSNPILIKEIKILRKTDRHLKQLIFIQKKIRFLRYLYGTEINGYVDHEKLKGLRTRIQFMAENVGNFCLAVWANEDQDDTFNIESKLTYLLCLIVLVELEMKRIFLCELKASKFTQSKTFTAKKLQKGFSDHLHNLLVYLRNKKLKNFVSAQNIDVAIDFLLVFLTDVPNHVINGKRLNEVLEKIGVLVGDILCLIRMLLEGSTISEDTSKINLDTIQILENIEDLKTHVEERYKSLKYSPFQFPTVGGLSFPDSLLRKLNEMLKSESSLDFLMKPHISVFEKELSYLTSTFRDVAKVQYKHDEILKDLQRRTVNLAYEAEFAVDSILVQYNSLWHYYCSLPAIITEIKNLRVKVIEVLSADVALKPCYVLEPSKHLPPHQNNLMNDDEIVGFEDDTKRIIQNLTGGTSALDVIPIVGMGGQGKTTIARKLYNNYIIVSHFDVRAWCIISQTYNRRGLLQEIFNQVTGSNGKEDEVCKLADMLRKILMGKRYLIVLDDMWDDMAWDDLRLCFRDGENGSRIIITTRLENVGRQVKYHTDPYVLPSLKPDESLKLLQKQVFQQEGCPPELQDVSQAVAKRCKGLPLVIILVAGIIKRNKMEGSWWHEVKNSMLSYLGESEGHSLSTMQLSYDNLPDYLKPCLLYMGMFPEDARIPVSKLISLWIAEDFVQNIESGRLMEETAECYLMDLISSNVVMVSKREYNGKVKYCQVHDVVLHFCLEKSREEKFMLVVKGDFQPCDWKESRVNYSLSEEHSKIVSLGSKTRNPFHQHLRSLIMAHTGGYFYWNPFHQCSEVRLLKVLDLYSHRVDLLLSSSLKPLIHLKYLAVNTREFHFHPEPHLLHLETLIVSCYFKSTLLPATFWKMEKLRHVEITDDLRFDWKNKKQGISEESSELKNLRILRKILIKIDDVAASVDELLERCPNLQELDISFKKFLKRGVCLKLDSLTQLQILSLSFAYPIVLSGLHLPSNLKKLVLINVHIGSAISFLSGLPSLEYLQLVRPYFIQSEEWCLGDITFDTLKVLKLSYLAISRWEASAEESFPLLETLVIRECDDLEEIPLSFADISTLKQIKLIECNGSLEASAVRIKEEVETISGCDSLDLIIIIKEQTEGMEIIF